MPRARWRLAAPGLALALALGCAGADIRDDPPTARGQAAEPTAPAPKPPPPRATPAPPAPTVTQVLPVSLDAVLRLAEEQNPQLGAARERVRQAYAEQEIAEKRWVPDVHVGTGYY